MSNVVEILISAKNLTGPALAAVNAEVDKTSKGMKTLNATAKIAAAGFAAVGVVAVKMAKDFDSNMALLQTQAGVSADKIDGLKKGILALSGKVAQDPDSLAKSLYHVESNFESTGITSKKALDMVATAAKGATTGHANLVDVTNALTAAVAANIPGVENLDQAMGTLNATVGVGDMSMSDLAKAFGGGNIAAVKGFGLSITDVGAALATFGDANQRGAAAGTALRMSVQALAHPVITAGDTLKKLGLQSDTLAKDMQRGGLKLAIEDLVAHMQAAGVSSKQTGEILTDAFGKKAGVGLNILVNSFDKLESKYPALEAGAKNAGKAFADTQKTFAFQVKSLEASFDALMITVGQKLIPPVQDFMDLLSKHRTTTIGTAEALAGLAAATIAVATAMKVAAGAKLAWTGITVGATAARGAMETFALKAMYARDASLAAGGGLKGLGAAFGTLSKTAKAGVVLAAIGGLVLLVDKLSHSNKQARISTDDLARALESGFSQGSAISPIIDNLRKAMQGLVKETDDTAGAWDKFAYSFTHFGAKFSSSASSAKAQANDFRDLGKAIGQIAQDKGISTATQALEMLARQGVKVPTKYLKDYNTALADAKIQSDLTAASQGRFGQQAQSVQQKLKAQQDVVDGLRQSLQALDQVNQDVYNSDTKFEDAISAATKGLKENGKTLDIHTDKGRANRDLVTALAAATDDYTAKLTAQNASWKTIDAAYKRGYDNLVKMLVGFGDSRKAAEKLANSLLQLPPEVKIGANIDDLERKVATAKAQMKTVPASKRAKLEAEIGQWEAQIRKAKADLKSVVGKTVPLTIVKTIVSGGSKVYHEGGNYAVGGHVVGPGSGTSDDVPIWASNGEFVVNASAAKRNRKLLEAINSGQMRGFASGGSVSSSERQARSSARGDLTLSYFGSRVYSRNEFQSGTASPSSLGDLVNTLNAWRAKIKAATHGAEESRLVKAFDSFGKSALKNEAALSKVNGQLSSAKDKLSALKDSFSQLKSSVSDAVVSFGSIVRQTGQPGGPGMLIGDLKNNVAQAKAFAADLEALRKKGLNSQSLSEIAQAGISGGGLETAQRLMGASKGDISEINSLEKQLQSAGSAAGTSAATGVYGAQINSAQALVTGLQKQQSKLNAVMEKAADAMAKRLKSAFGVKAAGGTVGAAAVGGAHWGRTLVGEQGMELVDLPIGSRVHSAPDTARMLAGGGNRPYVIQQTIVLDGKVLARQMLDPQRELVRQLGGNVQVAYGVRGK